MADMPLHRKIPFTLLVSIALLTSGCGGGSGSSGGGTTPPPPPSTAKEWTWTSGSSTVNATGVYGSLGVPASGNLPGGRSGAVSWIDGSGNLWLFGGYTVSSANDMYFYNDIWEYNSTTKIWTWVSGSSTVNSPGVYGTEGNAASGNVPGARSGAVSWIDSTGTFWLFGGNGYDSTGSQGWLNDLWEFNPTNKEWTWVSGSNVTGASASCYALQSIPAARSGAASWIDKSGNLWLFGGNGYGFLTCENAPLSDLWEFNPTNKEWTWVSGRTATGVGVYGTQGTPAAGNIPGARNGAVSWIDGSGNLWLFGGSGFGLTFAGGGLSDLWEFNPTSKEWTWVSGSSTVKTPGVYGTQGTPAGGNLPGARSGAVSWIDGGGNLWLIGGNGYDSTGTVGELNDLWEYNPTSKQWTWVSGSSTVKAVGVYSTLGTAATSNVPGSREGSVSWTDSSGNLWLFGGDGYDSTGTKGYLNDLWRYQP